MKHAMRMLSVAAMLGYMSPWEGALPMRHDGPYIRRPPSKEVRKRIAAKRRASASRKRNRK
jgi:hypothetical protein